MANRIDDDADERPAKKKKKKKQGQGPPVVLIAVGAVVLLLLLVGGGASAIYFMRPAPPAAPKKDEQAKGEEKKEGLKAIPPERIIVPKIGEGNPAAKKGGLGVVQNVRGAIYRSERRAELSGIHKFFTAYELETPRGQRSLNSYLTYIQRDYRPVHDAIKEGYYKVNLNVQPGSNEILAGERDIDAPGHLIIRASGAIEHVPADEFKKAFEMP